MEQKKEKLENYSLNSFTESVRGWLFLGWALFLFGFSPGAVNAATLYFSPSSGAHTIGQAFSVGIFTSSNDAAANAFQGVIDFPADKLQLTGLSKGGSIINLWVQEPAFSSSDGTAHFEGVVLNPGFTGGSGKIITLNFKVKAAGEATVSFTSGSVLANDGQGTNILSGLGSATFSLTAGGQPPPPEEQLPAPAATTQLPPAPKITSPDVPDSNGWYSIKNPTFEWSLPSGITGVSMAATKKPDSNPGTRSDGLMSTYSYQNVDDGVWYFHARLRNKQGWGPITHFRFQIDTIPPEQLTVTLVDDKGAKNSQPSVTIKAVDSGSGIARYKVQVDGGEFREVTPDEVNGKPYVLPTQRTGKHTLVVQVIDKAGNIATSAQDFTTKSLLPPEFTNYPEELQTGDILVLRGKTYPNSQVTLWLERDHDDIKRYLIKSNQLGNFIFVNVERVKSGIYQVWGDVTDGEGATSEPSKTITIAVDQSWWRKLLVRAVSYLTLLVPLVSMLILLLLLFVYIWRKLSMLKKQLRKEVRDVETSLHQAFDILRDDIRQQIKLLEKTQNKRELTVEEDKIIRRLKKDLDTAEKLVSKKIEQIEEEIK
ncbi:MAG: hypothetical protein HY983_03665 [Candidatus Magasanikbacteria bacterium]|nr:hypothetical protein [Candidatus Magasanikbacteria bacterium]